MKLLLTVCCAILVVVNLSFAESSDQQTAANAELLKELKALAAKVASLEKRLEVAALLANNIYPLAKFKRRRNTTS